MDQFFNWLDSQKDNAILIARVVVAVILIVSGFGKLFGMGIPMTIDVFANKIGLPGAPFFGTVVPLLEFFGGIAILLGVLTRLLSIWMIVQFGLITIWVKPILLGTGWSDVRIDLVLATLGILFITNGPGPASVGRMIGKGRKWLE